MSKGSGFMSAMAKPMEGMLGGLSFNQAQGGTGGGSGGSAGVMPSPLPQAPQQQIQAPPGQGMNPTPSGQEDYQHLARMLFDRVNFGA